MKKLKKSLFALLLICFFTIGSKVYAEEKIHVITMGAGGTDAIILESNGKFAMIDTGEDDSYPNGKNPRYPDRFGIIKNKESSIEDRVFSYIKKLGIKKFEFIIITHTHSDHIGNAPKILDTVPTDRIYLKKYSDDRITDKMRLWDNLYGYERTLESAKRNNVRVIQDISQFDSNISLENMRLKLYNYENEYDLSGKLKKVYDDNLNSIITVVEANGRRVFLGGDLENTDGREDFYGPIIGKVDMMKFNHHFDVYKANSKGFIENLKPKAMIKTTAHFLNSEYKKFMDEKNIELITAGRQDVESLVFELTNSGIKNTTENYIKYGFYKDNGILKFKNWKGDFMPGITFHMDGRYKFNPDGTVHFGWVNDNYYADEDNGRFVTSNWKKIDGYWYYFSNYGNKNKGWTKYKDRWYFNDNTGKMLTDTWVGEYYVGSDGAMLTDTVTPDGYYVGKDGKYEKNGTWVKINSKWKFKIGDNFLKYNWIRQKNKWYFLGNDEFMVTGWNYIDRNWYFFDDSGAMLENQWKDDFYLGSNGAMLRNSDTPDGLKVDNNGRKIKPDSWVKYEDNWKYIDKDYKFVKNAWIDFKGNKYYIGNNEFMVIGWEKIGENWYFFEREKGSMVTNSWVGEYYLGKDGKMLVDTTTPDGSKVGKDGKKITTDNWIEIGDKWKFVDDKGNFVKNKWIDYKGRKYYIGNDEFMVIGWQKIEGKWYFFNEEKGHMLTNSWVGSYYVGENGQRLINTTTPDGYYIDKDGKYEVKGVWVTEVEGKKFKINNVFAKNEWLKYHDKWYYLGNNEFAVKGWNYIKGSWYFFDDSAVMLENQWKDDFYLGPDGKLLKNSDTPDGFKVDNNGKKIKPNSWVKYEDKWKYIDENYKFVKNKWIEFKEKRYYVGNDEFMVIGWEKIDDFWYFFDREKGNMITNSWVGDYYLGKDGKMLVDTVTPDGFRVGKDGKKIKEN